MHLALWQNTSALQVKKQIHLKLVQGMLPSQQIITLDMNENLTHAGITYQKLHSIKI